MSFPETKALVGHTGYVTSVAYSPNGKHVVSGSYDKTARVWDADTGQCVSTLSGHTESVYSVAYSPDGRNIVSASWDETVRVWDAETNSCVSTLQGFNYLIRSSTSVYYQKDNRIYCELIPFFSVSTILTGILDRTVHSRLCDNRLSDPRIWQKIRKLI